MKKLIFVILFLQYIKQIDAACDNVIRYERPDHRCISNNDCDAGRCCHQSGYCHSCMNRGACRPD